MSMTQDQSNEWATPSLKEAPYWRDGMTPEEYEDERKYLIDNFHLVQSGEYLPLWKQREKH